MLKVSSSFINTFFAEPFLNVADDSRTLYPIISSYAHINASIKSICHQSDMGNILLQGR